MENIMKVRNSQRQRSMIYLTSLHCMSKIALLKLQQKLPCENKGVAMSKHSVNI
jgi:hypothetical protein